MTIVNFSIPEFLGIIFGACVIVEMTLAFLWGIDGIVNYFRTSNRRFRV